MYCLRSILTVTVLFLSGCLVTAPNVRLPFNDPDPFPIAPTIPTAPFAELQPETPIAAEADSVKTQPQPEIVEPESLLELEENHQITEDEQAELLSQNLWVKNLALINYLDSGKKPEAIDISPQERQRREENRRLNMSRQELAKQKNQRFEYADGSVSNWRWMHRGVDKLYSVPPDQRTSPECFLRNVKYRDEKYKTLRANAAILMGRDGNPVVAQRLLQLVKNENAELKLRCAAAEVLGHMPTVTADELVPLLDSVKEREVEVKNRQTGEMIRQRQPGVTEIWSELLIAIAEKTDPWQHPCFLEPLTSVTSDIRLETAKIWRRKSLQKQNQNETIPEKFLELVPREANPVVRSEMIKTLGAWDVPDLFRFLQRDLHHPIAEIRNTAMLVLAENGSQDAVPMIKDQLRDSNGLNRAAAVAALCKLGAIDDVFKLVNDEDWRVREEVAKGFSERCTSQTAAFAKSYITDRYQKVQLAAIEAVGGWSIEESCPLLLDALKSSSPEVRRRATAILAKKGISSPNFDPEEMPKNQTMQHQELVRLFSESVGLVPNEELDHVTQKREELPIKTSAEKNPGEKIRQVSASMPENAALTEIRRCLDDWADSSLPQDQRPLIQRRLTVYGSRLMPIIDHLLTVEERKIPESLDQVFAEVEPVFEQIEKLRSDDNVTKRRGAIELARLGSLGNPSKLAAKRIIDLAARQTDALVLTSLLSALQHADPDLVCELARPLLQSDSAEVRRVSCEMLKSFGSADDIEPLQDLLQDPSRGVVRGALQAIDTLLEESDGDNSAIFETLKAKLTKGGDPLLQTDIAATLHRLGQNEGRDALRRLAVSGDNRVRSYVAKTVSESADPEFIPLLLRYLEDNNGTVRNDALKGLPKLTGKDIGLGGSTQEQIDRWRNWAKDITNSNPTR